MLIWRAGWYHLWSIKMMSWFECVVVVIIKPMMRCHIDSYYEMYFDDSDMKSIQLSNNPTCYFDTESVVILTSTWPSLACWAFNSNWLMWTPSFTIFALLDGLQPTKYRVRSLVQYSLLMKRYLVCWCIDLHKIRVWFAAELI